MELEDLRTPAFLVDVDQVKKNCEHMRERCEKLGVTLRPHMKTHKTLEAAKYMTNGMQTGVVVSTLSEAEFYAEAGLKDITYGYPITQDKLPQAARLNEKLERFHVFVDNDVILKALVDHKLPKAKKWSVFMATDCGDNREGVLYDDPYMVELAKAITSHPDCIEFRGLYTHCGDSYLASGEDEIRESGKATCNRFMYAVERLQKEGIPCPMVTTGSTPNCSKPPSNLEVITEFHPGNYVFYDYQQYLVGSCTLDEVAVRVLSRVIGHYPHKGHLLIDCGFTGLSHDGMRRLPQDNFCLIDGHPELKLVSTTQEIGTVRSSDEGGAIDFARYPIGSFLELVPYHACATAYMHGRYYIRENGKIIDQWIPHHKGW